MLFSSLLFLIIRQKKREGVYTEYTPSVWGESRGADTFGALDGLKRREGKRGGKGKKGGKLH
jgi:hypothetical protein